MTQPTYAICIDWECTDWAGTHDFTSTSPVVDDITNYVKSLRILRGANWDQRIYPAATLELTLENSDGRFYPTLSTGPYYGYLRLWLPVRVIATYDGDSYPLFYGYLNRITVYPLKSKQEAYFYATDGLDLLAKTIVVQDLDDKTTQSDGASVIETLSAAGWNADRRDIDIDGGGVTSFPSTTGYIV